MVQISSPQPRRRPKAWLRTEPGLLSARTLTAVIVIFGLWTSPSTAEPYIAAYGGITLPQSLSDIEEYKPEVIPSGSTLSDLSLKSSAMYGAKIGYFFESRKWLGLELELFHANPHVKQQRVIETLPGSAPTEETRQGVKHFVNAIALNAITRHRFGRFEPYVGIGVAGFLAQLDGMRRMGAPPLSISSGRAGLNTQLGLRHYMTEHLTLFGEWKFNYARFYYDSPQTVKTTYTAHHLVIGIGYHF